MSNIRSNDLAAIGWLHRKAVRLPDYLENKRPKHIRDAATFPVVGLIARKELSKNDICPECGGGLDTGWECNDCEFDAHQLATGEVMVTAP